MTRYRSVFGRRVRPGLMRLEEVLAALGDDGDMGWRTADVPLANVVGTVDRLGDFGHEFRLVNQALADRWARLACAVEAGLEPPAVELVQLGDLYFVSDGHHRVSVARAVGATVIPARVHRICTIAYAMSCLRAAHLPSKAAEREFLERVPLPEERRRDLWLDEPAEWMRLADAAEAWGMRRSLEHGCPPDRCDLAGVVGRGGRAGAGPATRRRCRPGPPRRPAVRDGAGDSRSPG